MNKLHKLLPAVCQFHDSKQVNLNISTKLYLIWLKTVLNHLIQENSEFLLLIEELYSQHAPVLSNIIPSCKHSKKSASSYSSAILHQIDGNSRLLKLKVVSQEKKRRKKVKQNIKKILKKVGFSLPAKENEDPDLRTTFPSGNSNETMVSDQSQPSNQSSSSIERKVNSDMKRFSLQLVKVSLEDCCLSKYLATYANKNLIGEDNSNVNIVRRISSEDVEKASNSLIKAKVKLLLSELVNEQSSFDCSKNNLLFPAIDPMWSSSSMSNDSIFAEATAFHVSTPKKRASISNVSTSTLDDINAEPFKLNERAYMRSLNESTPIISQRVNEEALIPDHSLNTPVNNSLSKMLTREVSPWLTPGFAMDVADSISWEMISKCSPNYSKFLFPL